MIRKLFNKNYLDNIDAVLQGFTDHVEKLTHKGKVSLSADSDEILLFVKQ
ncbi:hypothetical protein VCRA2123O444_330004 [Vibrio crassostreae]|nr:hypothetical protein VCRA2119O432_310002 [Vibrio crassostreae]CAK2021945.1 hypothetical protein VCRA2113O413_310041 [Vibrio crassostreae]CAK2023083.1 hypothetical protein VCRA2117O428_320004 [Vibrio crassostreae]CAK2023648.1 hypothetical protein VCRA2118O429_300041 [Vibrio crassostreae]CAK2023735.1 hypothetical protein VCRA2114O421_320002 [Vibrio crassostreae]